MNPANADAATARAAAEFKMYTGIAGDLRERLTPECTILDFGCGSGRTVREFRRQGFKAFGVDIDPTFAAAESECVRDGSARQGEQVFRLLDLNHYRLPFDDNSFDFIWSNQVFEHVQNYEQAISELSRVLKPGGWSLHIFPSRLSPLEPHTYVPGATVLRSRGYLYFWAALGLRNQFQRNLKASEVATINEEYLRTRTAYHSLGRIRQICEPFFGSFGTATIPFARHCFGQKKVIYSLASLPFMADVIETFFQRTIVLKNPRVGTHGLNDQTLSQIPVIDARGPLRKAS